MAKILVHYFAGADLGIFAESIGADYDHELSKYPEWAIRKARQWWISVDNPKRSRKPLPGDLAERIEVEMTVIRCAKNRLRQSLPKPTTIDPEREVEKYDPAEIIREVAASRSTKDDYRA